MKVIKVKNTAEGGKSAFRILQEEMASGAKTLGLATGSTPLGLYKEMRESALDFSDMVSVNLDEYVGLSADDPNSYAYFMKQHLFTAKPFKTSFLPNGLAADLQAEAQRYEDLIAEHPIDLQILGIGRNGHIGFNEPGTPFDIPTHVVDLTESTIQANSRFFEKAEDVPKQAISMGIASIMKSKIIILMAYGKEKADAVAAAVQGPIRESLPASVLQRHPNVILIVDEEAGAKLL
ncbi:glucosamine-6-phosphate deaminase [Streptococcus macacae]|uniref:Glucosamine-6-phosphate deaminase n=1 Tax=Streptococcus macacae NCTC 11558 TaxID=764298 RepID=G5JUU9_9STRE|nr:glucosamine-6-phosphate deaminase [Streptococcus macacae]EHJ53066.1 glucosamine-6-phosphate deaminase [Streptococcus macacae NCTC 11558]SUN78913.1 N-acetylglucosamine-6-phosphate isomerase [Streptococcus macacae NCTC 11558]